MATAVERCSASATAAGSRRQPSRLQRRAPASIQIDRVPDWNVAIPLLSPLATSPVDRTVEVKSKQEQQQQQQQRQIAAEHETPVFKKWQHPAAPFCYEPAPFMPSFVM